MNRRHGVHAGCALLAGLIWPTHVGCSGGGSGGGGGGGTTVTSVSPDSATQDGSTLFTITGDGLQAVTAVRFGGAQATGLSRAPDGRTLTGLTPAGYGRGVVDVTVVTPGGSSTLTQAFEYFDAPLTLTGVTPPAALTGSAIAVTLTGTGFLRGDAGNPTTVRVGSLAATSVTVTSGTQLTCTFPNDAAGPKDVVLTNADGLPVTLSAGFRRISTAAQDGVGQLVAGVMTFGRSIPNSPNAAGLSYPQGVAVDTVHHRLFVSDTSNNRVLVYTLSAADDFTGVDRVPDFVLGQPNKASSLRESGAAGLEHPIGLAYDAARDLLFVGELGRVLVFDVATIVDGEAAINVIGQPSLTTKVVVTGAAGIGSCADLLLNGTELFVADSFYNRVLRFDVATLTNGPSADLVLGQPDFVSFGADFGAAGTDTSSTGLQSPSGLAIDGDRLFVADRDNHRVLVFDVAAPSSGQAAIGVLGQSTFTTAAPGTTATTMEYANGLAFDATGQRLFVADESNARVLVFDAATIVDGEAAVNVLGQPDLTTKIGGTTRSRFRTPDALALAGDLLWVTDGDNRVLSFDVAAMTDGEDAADGVGHLDGTGAMDFTRDQENDPPSAIGLDLPLGVALDPIGHRLFVSDSQNARILVHQLSAANDFAGVDRVPDFVLGQPDVGTVVDPTFTPSAVNLLAPGALLHDPAGDRLFVVDAGFNRVLVFDVAVIVDNEAAIAVLGQGSFASDLDGSGASGLDLESSAGGLALGGSKLFVSDSNNARVVVFDVTSIVDGEAAESVLGAADLTTPPFVPAAAQNTLLGPGALALGPSNQLAVHDTGFDRVMIFDVAVITNGENAVAVLGQPTFDSAASGTTATLLYSSSLGGGLAWDVTRGRLYVSDGFNNRVLVFSDLTTSAAAIGVYGQPDFTSSAEGSSETELARPEQLVFDPVSARFFAVDSATNRVLLFEGAP